MFAHRAFEGAEADIGCCANSKPWKLVGCGNGSGGAGSVVLGGFPTNLSVVESMQRRMALMFSEAFRTPIQGMKQIKSTSPYSTLPIVTCDSCYDDAFRCPTSDRS